ncbi:hypothetical protein EI171_11385 [Bradyrhizobium sp. LCT2]|nr:hypothetical protein EI171_11385 [Bradyrhizobium sp. LCT2]
MSHVVSTRKYCSYCGIYKSLRVCVRAPVKNSSILPALSIRRWALGLGPWALGLGPWALGLGPGQTKGRRTPPRPEGLA